MKIDEFLLCKGLRKWECDEYPMYNLRDWASMRWYKKSEISLDEMITISEIYMMYGSRYDEVILNDYDKAIKGYKNWNDFRRRTQLFYLGKEHYINKEEILYNLIDKECKYLFDYNRSVSDCRSDDGKGYLCSSSQLIILLRLYHLKGYDKSIVINYLNGMNTIPSYEPQRLSLILSLMKTWSYGALSRIVYMDLSERLYCLSINKNPWSFLNLDIDYALTSENEDDEKVIEKFNIIY